MHAHTYTNASCISAIINTNMHAWTHTNMHVYIHTGMNYHAYRHIYLHACMHTECNTWQYVFQTKSDHRCERTNMAVK